MNYLELTHKLIHILLTEPRLLFCYFKALLKGFGYIAYFRLFKPNIVIKFPFFVYYRLKISGPGKVFINRGCSVYANSFDGLVITTLSRHAQVIIGKGCDLGGMTIRCSNRISIGDFVMSANCLLQDSLFAVRRQSDLKRADQVEREKTSSSLSIGSRVWLTGQTILLAGTDIGDESVLGVGSLCFDRKIAKSHLAVGNPVVSSVSIERLEKMVSSG